MDQGCGRRWGEGLASVAELEAGGGHHGSRNKHPMYSRSLKCYDSIGSPRWPPGGGNSRSLGLPAGAHSFNSIFSPRYGRGRFDDQGLHDQPHFLEACFLCGKPLGDNHDIFMYRGDTPFCSEECRQEQIEMDEAKEKMSSSSSSMKVVASKKSTTNPKSYPFRTAGTVGAA